MPDYKLKVEIDSSKLERALKDSMRNLQLSFGGSSGGTPRSASGAGQAVERQLEEFQKKSLKVIKIQHESDKEAIKLKYALNKEYAQLRANLVRENSVFRQFGGPFSAIGNMIAGRAGGGIGRLLDLKMKSGEPGKGIPQFVKIAGFAAGLAGAAGLGKLIIDSSPVLQAMLKLLNVGVMFMLRPIGDFIGFILRPFILMFLKFAIPFYKRFGGGNALNLADKFLEGDVSGAVDVIDAQTSDGEGFFGAALNFVKEISGFNALKNLLDLSKGIGLLGASLNILPAVWASGFDANMKQLSPDGKEYFGPGFSGLAGGTNPEGVLDPDNRVAGMHVLLKEGLKLQDIPLEIEKGVNFAHETQGFMENINEVFSNMEKEDSKAMQTSMQLAGIEFIKIKQNANLSSNAMTSITKVFTDTLKRVQSALSLLSRTQSSTGSQSSSGQAADEAAKVLGGGGNIVVEKHGWRFFKPDGSIGKEVVGSHKVTRRELDEWKNKGPGYRVEGFASGGFINEPVFGVGQNTGKGYLLGESGPEQVTPVGGNTGGGITANFYISGMMDVNQLESKLKPAISKWLKEEASRKGIL